MHKSLTMLDHTEALSKRTTVSDAEKTSLPPLKIRKKERLLWFQRQRLTFPSVSVNE